MTNEEPEETVWSAAPPSQIPPGTVLRLRAFVKVEGLCGRAAFLRLRYHTFFLHPTPHVEWVKTLEPVTGTGTADWMEIAVPELAVPSEHFDYLVRIDFVLDGEGTAWLTDLDVDLNIPDLPSPETPDRTGTPALARALAFRPGPMPTRRPDTGRRACSA